MIARFFVVQHNVAFSNKMLIVHYTHKRTHLAERLMHCLANNGTWVRFPGPPYFSIYFVLTYFHAVHAPGSTMRLHLLACHMSPEIHPKAKTCRSHWTLVNACTRNQKKSKKGLTMVGQVAQTYLQRGQQTPLCLYLFSHSFFSFFVCFNLMIFFFLFIK